MKWISNPPWLIAGLLLLAAACGGDDNTQNTNQSDETNDPQIESFESNFSSITSGSNSFGNAVQGEVELSWTATGSVIELYANDQVVDLEAGANSITLRPVADTTFRLVALASADTSCEFDGDEILNPDYCHSASLDVKVFAPATLSLSADTIIAEPDDELAVDFSVQNATSWQLGILIDEAIQACDIESETAPCSLPADSNSGQATFRNINTAITVSGAATNGAADGLGDVAPGDVTLNLIPADDALILDFSSDKSHVAFGEYIELSWETQNATAVEVSSNAEIVLTTDLAECTALNASGKGKCEVHFATNVPAFTIDFTLTAIDAEGGESQPRTISVVLGAAPTIEEFSADPSLLPVDGGDVELSWITTGEPTRLIILDGADIPNILLDTDAGTGEEDCHNNCDFTSDSFSVSNVTTNTRYTLVISSSLGSTSASVNITITGAPQITSITIDGEDAGQSPMIDADAATLSWQSTGASSAELARALPFDGSCNSPEIDWTPVSAFTGEASGDFEISDLAGLENCFRLTVHGDADQSARETFHIVRHPRIDSFSTDRATLQTGDDLELSWITPFALSTSVTVSPGGAVTGDDLAGCTTVDDSFQGSCTVKIQPGTSLGDVTFTLTAFGFDDVETDPQETLITLGSPPTIDLFTSDPATAVDSANVTLSWMSTNGTALSILEDGTEIHTSTNDAEISQSSFTISDLDITTTWTLEVSNVYGTATAQATTFFGPSVDNFTINGGDGLSGEVHVLTGDVSFDWTTTNADSSLLEFALVPDSGSCNAVADWTEITSVLTGDGDHLEADVIENGCYRLTVTNDAAQSNSVVVLVRDFPFLGDFTTTPGSINGDDGGAILISFGFTGVSNFTLVAHFLTADGTVHSTESICNESGYIGAPLTADTQENEVNCSHSMAGERCFPLFGICSYDPPAAATSIEYQLTFRDSDGDQVEAFTAEQELVTID